MIIFSVKLESVNNCSVIFLFIPQAEDDVLQQQIEFYNHRLKEIEEHHRRHTDQIQQLKKMHYWTRSSSSNNSKKGN